MDVLIIGAGIAGLTTALGLHQAGFQPRVYDGSAATDVPGGHGLLHVNPAGQAAFDQLGLGSTVRAAGFPVSAVALADATGAQIGTFPAAGGNYRYIPRAELLSLLIDTAHARGIPIAYEHRVTKLTPSEGTVTVSFETGTDVDTELVIGADGVHSTARDVVDPHITPDYSGQWFVHGIASTAHRHSAPTVAHVVRDTTTHHAFGWISPDEHRTWWWLRVTAPPLDGPPQLEDLADYVPEHCPGNELLMVTENELAYYPASTVPPLQVRWHTDSIALVGDAVHACSPASSQNTALAVEGAVTLARALRDNPPSTALARYTQMCSSRAARAIAAGNPRNGIQPGPALPIGWSTIITAELAETVADEHRL